MSEEWGPWIEHDGISRPSSLRAGDTVNVVGKNYDGSVHDAVGEFEEWHADLPQWKWRLYGKDIGHIYRYRIRRPRALLQLIEMVENLPAQAQPRVDA